MRAVSLILSVLSVVGLSACVHETPVMVTPNTNVYSSYGNRVSGDFLLYVDSSSLNTTVRNSAPIYYCQSAIYSVDMRQIFRDSVARTMEQLVGSVQIVDAPVAATELSRLNKAGMIVVRATGIYATVQIEPDVWTNVAEAKASMSASMTIDTQAGRLFETTASGNLMTGRSGGLVGCGMGTAALRQASEASMVDMLGKMGDRIVNLERLREAQ